MPFFSIPYLGLILFYISLVLIDISKQSTPKLHFIIRLSCCLAFLWFIGLRGFIGTDWYSYYAIYDKAVPISELLDYFSKEQFIEFGFGIYISFFKTIGLNYHFFVFISALFDVLILNFFLKKYSPYYALGFLVFFAFEGLGMPDLMRNVRSIMFFLLSLNYILERKLLPFLLLNFIGLCFHASAILYFPLYFILHKQWSKKLLIGAFVIGNLLFLGNIDLFKPLILKFTEILGGRYSLLAENYIQSTLFSSKEISIGYFERCFTCLMVISYYNKIIAYDKRNIIFLNAYTLYIFAIFFFADIAVIAARLALLFVFSYWILWPTLFKVIILKVNKYCFLTFMFIYILLKINGITNNPLWEYDNFSWGMKSYEERSQVFYHYSDKPFGND